MTNNINTLARKLTDHILGDTGLTACDQCVHIADVTGAPCEYCSYNDPSLPGNSFELDEPWATALELRGALDEA